jgi:hypothetical protein
MHAARKQLHRKERGAFYTPAPIVEAILDGTLESCLRAVARPTILDPACGDGAFLVAAFRRLLARQPKRARSSLAARTRLLRESIYGVDIDARTVEACRRSLHVVLHEGPAEGKVDDTWVNNIRCADALAADLDWRSEFPCFDVVVGNPPWVSLSGRFAAQRLAPDRLASLVQRFGGNRYMPNLYEFFLALALELTAPGGYLGFVVPDRLASNAQQRWLRERLLRDSRIVELAYRVPFPGVTADVLTVVCQRGSAPPEHQLAIRHFTEGSKLTSQLQIAKDPERRFPRPGLAEVTELIEKMERSPRCIPLGQLADITSGFGGRSRLIQPTRTDRLQIPVLKGECIGRYRHSTPFWFDFRREHLTGRTTDRAKLGAGPKILIRKTGDRIIATFDDSGFFPEQSLYFLYNARVDYLYLLGVLNSRLLTLYYRERCLTNAGSIAQVKKVDLERLPIPVLDPGARRHERMRELVMMRLAGETATETAIDRLVCGLFGVDSRALLGKE